MKLDSLLARMAQVAMFSEEDPEKAHMEADLLLLEYIGNPKVLAAYDEVVKFYGRHENCEGIPVVAAVPSPSVPGGV